MQEIQNRESTLTQGERIQKVLEQYPEIAKNYSLRQLGSEGWVLDKKDFSSSRSKMVFFDFDDALAKYSEAKNVRLENIASALETIIGPTSTEIDYKDIAKKLIRKTDEIARWNTASNKEMYHIKTHIYTLFLLINEFRNLVHPDNQLLGEPMSIAQASDYVLTNALVIASRRPSFTEEKMVGMESITDAFHTSMQELDTYEDIAEISQDKDVNEKADVSILTYGEADFQLAKIFYYLSQNGFTNFAHIYLSTTPKGVFLTSLASEKNATTHDLGPSKWVIVDDSEAEQRSIGNSAESLKKMGVTVEQLRVMRPGIKTTERHPSSNFTSIQLPENGEQLKNKLISLIES